MLHGVKTDYFLAGAQFFAVVSPASQPPQPNFLPDRRMDRVWIASVNDFHAVQMILYARLCGSKNSNKANKPHWGQLEVYGDY